MKYKIEKIDKEGSSSDIKIEEGGLIIFHEDVLLLLLLLLLLQLLPTIKLVYRINNRSCYYSIMAAALQHGILFLVFDNRTKNDPSSERVGRPRSFFLVLFRSPKFRKIKPVQTRALLRPPSLLCIDC
jgi:hypothetical protein